MIVCVTVSRMLAPKASAWKKSVSALHVSKNPSSGAPIFL
jgi:hypothetical protein